MKIFLKRLMLYILAFGFVLLLVCPLVVPIVVSVIVFLYKGQWNGWELQAAWRIFKSGLIITPSAAFLLTLNEYARYRGWWK